MLANLEIAPDVHIEHIKKGVWYNKNWNGQVTWNESRIWADTVMEL